MPLNHYKTSFLKDLDAKYKDPNTAILVKSLFNGLFAYCLPHYTTEPYSAILKIENAMHVNIDNVEDFAKEICLSLSDNDKAEFEPFFIASPEEQREIYADFYKVIHSEYLLLKRDRYYENTGVNF